MPIRFVLAMCASASFFALFGCGEESAPDFGAETSDGGTSASEGGCEQPLSGTYSVVEWEKNEGDSCGSVPERMLTVGEPITMPPLGNFREEYPCESEMRVVDHNCGLDIFIRCVHMTNPNLSWSYTGTVTQTDGPDRAAGVGNWQLFEAPDDTECNAPYEIRFRRPTNADEAEHD